jgi:hypothetical protein
MEKYKIKNLLREMVENQDKDLINAAISYIVKSNELEHISPGVKLFSKVILCDKRNGNNRDYGKINQKALELSKMEIDKVEEIKNIDPELFKTMVSDGSVRKYRKLWDEGNRIITIGG